jgi:hypothetical protein
MLLHVTQNRFVLIGAIVMCAIFTFAPVTFADHGDEAAVSHATTVHAHDVSVHASGGLTTTVTYAPTVNVSKVIAMQELFKSLTALVSLLEQKRDLIGHAHSNESDHDHTKLYEINQNVPTLEVEIVEGIKGYAVHAKTTNFTFTPQNADLAHVDNEGHAHIYLDGVKISRMYGPWFYLAEITQKGDHTIRVELSTNDHKTYAHDGKMIDDTVTIEVK